MGGRKEGEAILGEGRILERKEEKTIEKRREKCENKKKNKRVLK